MNKKLIFSILISIFVSKVILDPISRLIDRAPRIAAGEDFGVDDIRRNNQTDELTNAFNLMTNELRENLNEVNRQEVFEYIGNWLDEKNNFDISNIVTINK